MSFVEWFLVVKTKGYNFLGVVVESRIVGIRGIVKLDFLDGVVCQGSRVKSDRFQGFKLGGVLNINILFWKERFFFRKSSCVQCRRVCDIQQVVGKQNFNLGGNLGLEIEIWDSFVWRLELKLLGRKEDVKREGVGGEGIGEVLVFSCVQYQGGESEGVKEQGNLGRKWWE